LVDARPAQILIFKLQHYQEYPARSCGVFSFWFPEVLQIDSHLQEEGANSFVKSGTIRFFKSSGKWYASVIKSNGMDGEG
jgi:hypothetical protein